MPMKRITSNDDLTPGLWYWLRPKGGVLLANGKVSEPGDFSAKKVTRSHWKAIGDVWCDPDNDQALAMFDIYGPIPLPSPDA
jgi:hypothetical protein